VFRLSQGSVATLIKWCVWNSYSHNVVHFINSENGSKINWALTKLQTKVSWLRLWPTV